MVVKIAFLLIAFLILTLNALPNYLAFLKTPPGQVFSGQASWFDPWDINAYVAALGQGQSGNLLLQNSYTTLSHQPVLYYPLYTLTGYLLPKVNSFLLFHILAGAVGLLLFFTIWRTSNFFLKSEKRSLLAALMISLGGGLGWMFFPTVQSSDLFMTGFTFTSHFQRAHEGLAVIFYLLTFGFFYLAVEKRSLIFNLFSLASLSLLALFYPFYILSFALVGGLYSFTVYLRREETFPLTYFSASLITGGITSLMYIAHLGSSNAFGSVLGQNLPTPDLPEIILGYGVLLPLFLYSLKYGKGPGKLFLSLWFIVNILLAYLPFGFARFYLRTLYFPLILLSLPVIIKLFQSKNLLLKLSALLLIGSVLVSGFFITYKRLLEIGNRNPWYYLSKEEGEAIRFLRTGQSAGVLAAYRLGNILPALTQNSVYFGHLLQTPKAQEKISGLYRFYGGNLSETEARQFLKDEGVDYIIWGAEEQIMSENAGYDFLKPVFERGQITIFESP